MDDARDRAGRAGGSSEVPCEREDDEGPCAHGAGRVGELGSPLLRWQARAALSRAERAAGGASDEADRYAEEAIDIIHAVVKELTPEHAEGYLAAAPVVEALELVH